jgi:predicted RNA binding protein YcfA (HicA-like mRNA interferase family)
MKLRNISGLELIKSLKKLGYIATRQKGSHVRLEKPFNGNLRKLTVPLHKAMKIGTLTCNRNHSNSIYVS